jgi:quercetin dioxygenase-like cupin family protein
MSDVKSVPRRHETPNAVMYTYASRALTGSDLAVWRVEMEPGAVGPVHSVDVEQVLVVLQGALQVDLDGTTYDVGPQRSRVLPANAQRQLSNTSVGSTVAIVSSRSGARASTAERSDVAIPWAE